MSISSALSTAVSGLSAAQARAQTVAHNIANSTTEGYVRRSVALSERVVGGIGQGVDISATTRATAGFLTTERLRLEGDSSFASEQAAAATRVAALLGEPGASDGLSGAYASFETALRDAAATPESAVLQRQVVDTATDIVNEFHRLAEDSRRIRDDADRDIGRAVQDVNDALKRLEEINGLGGSAVTPDVLDERQRLVDRVNEIVPVTPQVAGGTLYLVTEGGTTLLGVNAEQIDFTPAVYVTREQTIGGGLSGLSVGGTDITSTIGGGRLGALLETRDVRVPAFDNQLDALAVDLVNRFSADSSDPTKPAGEVGLFNVGSTTPPADGDIGVASLLGVNAAVDPDQGGELYRIRDGIGAVAPGPSGAGDQLNRLLDAFTGRQPTPGVFGGAGQQTANDLVASLTSELNYEVQRTEERSLFASTRAEAAVSEEIQAIGVDTDAELQELLQVEQAYSANARVIQTINRLVDQLIDIA